MNYHILKRGNLPEQLKRYLQKPCAVILNSRQTKFPRGSDPWIVQSARAADTYASLGYTLLCSVEMNTYEFVLWYAGMKGYPVAVLVPVWGSGDARETAGKAGDDFSLSPEAAEFFSCITGIPEQRHKDFWPERDRALAETADAVCPVSIRPDGNLAELIETLPGVKVRRDFQISYEDNAGRGRGGVSLPEVRRFPGWGYLTHWTRSFHGTFPGESKAEYYRAVYQSGGDNSHSAEQALRRILHSGKVYASSDGIRGGFEGVSLTADEPADSLGIVRWRSRKERYTYEPYGLAFDTETLKELGARPVIYGSDEDFDDMYDQDKPFFQFRGRDGRWVQENEWRLPSSLDLEGIPPDKLKILVPDRECAKRIREGAAKSSFDIIPLDGKEEK